MRARKSEARVTAERGGERVVDKEVPLDPFLVLVSPDKPQATVGIVVGKSMDYGALKVSASVTLTCDQTATAINEAGLKAFEKATEFVNDSWTLLTEGT